MSNSELSQTHLQIGVITRPHGVRGELKVRLHNEESDALLAVTTLLVKPQRGAPLSLAVEGVRGSSKGPIITLAGVVGRDAADALRGAELWVERASLEPLEEGEYYLVDLIGCQVVFAEQVIAQVTDVRPDPSVDTMLLRMKDGRSAEMPIVEAWVGQVDIAQKKIHLSSEDGIIFE